MSSVLAATAARTALHRRCFIHLHSFLITTSCRYSHVYHGVLIADPISCKVKNIHPFFLFCVCKASEGLVRESFRPIENRTNELALLIWCPAQTMAITCFLQDANLSTLEQLHTMAGLSPSKGSTWHPTKSSIAGIPTQGGAFLLVGSASSAESARIRYSQEKQESSQSIGC